MQPQKGIPIALVSDPNIRTSIYRFKNVPATENPEDFLPGPVTIQRQEKYATLGHRTINADINQEQRKVPWVICTGQNDEMIGSIELNQQDYAVLSVEKDTQGNPCFSLSVVDDWYNFVAFNREADKEVDIDQLEERMEARKKALLRGLKGETGDDEVEKRVKMRRENRARRGRRGGGGGGGGGDDDDDGGGGDEGFGYGAEDVDFEDEFSEGSAPDLEVSDADNDDAADEPERDEDGKIIQDAGDDDFDEDLDEESEEGKDKPALDANGKPIIVPPVAAAAPPGQQQPQQPQSQQQSQSLPALSPVAPAAASSAKKRAAEPDAANAAKKPKTSDVISAPKVHEVPFTLTVDHLIEIFITKGFKTSKEIMEHFKPLAAGMRDGPARLNELFKQTFTWDNKELKTVRVKKEFAHLAAKWQMSDD